MAAIRRRSLSSPVSRIFTLATADDLDGVADTTQTYDVTGARRLIVVQENTGTAGTAGIDVLEVSKDGGSTWASAEDGLAIDSNDATGTVLVSGALNAAGVEPVQAALFKFGPFEGPTKVRITRNAATNAASAAWVTGAPKVYGFIVGGNTGGQLTAG